MNFDQAFALVIGNEGGYVNDPHDPGGETKYGVSKRSYPMEDIPNLTLERSKELYYRDFWGPAGCDAVPHSIKYDLFDVAVNTSAPGHCTTAIKILQHAVDATPDGVLGPLTLQAVQSMDPERLNARFNGWALDYLLHLDNWPRYGHGWGQRCANRLKRA